MGNEHLLPEDEADTPLQDRLASDEASADQGNVISGQGDSSSRIVTETPDDGQYFLGPRARRNL